jgi:hypothetical protein
MTDPWEQALRRNTADLTLDTPVAVVLARGDQTRRRRRRSAVVITAAGAAAAVTIGAVTLAHQPGGRGLTDAVDGARPVADQVASWSGSSTNLSADRLADVEATCADGARRIPSSNGSDPAGLQLLDAASPVAAEQRGDTVLAYYGEGRDYATCTLELGSDGALRTTGMSAGAVEPISAERHVSLAAGGSAERAPYGHALTMAFVVLRTAPDVAQVEVAFGDEVYERRAQDGLAFFLFDDDTVTQAELNRAVVTVLDDNGDVLHRSDPGAGW